VPQSGTGMKRALSQPRPWHRSGKTNIVGISKNVGNR
jgi:hypothetical protein